MEAPVNGGSNSNCPKRRKSAIVIRESRVEGLSLNGSKRREAKLVWKNCCLAGNPSLYKFSEQVLEQNFDRREVEAPRGVEPSRTKRNHLEEKKMKGNQGNAIPFLTTRGAKPAKVQVGLLTAGQLVASGQFPLSEPRKVASLLLLRLVLCVELILEVRSSNYEGNLLQAIVVNKGMNLWKEGIKEWMCRGGTREQEECSLVASIERKAAVPSLLALLQAPENCFDFDGWISST
ncbi:hypothetical protein Bca52824_048647 [Brassica carinata]|uniref:Uncharacterized protein n=1 Tax=Brassica carinata TaxID=52824 RepID=A0A8X7RGY1_BRACI|nr:hypothetical protein Bca52824_048647 [Brassica carinata]